MLYNSNYYVLISHNKTNYLLSCHNKCDIPNIIKIVNSFENEENLLFWLNNHQIIFENLKYLYSIYLSDLPISFNRFVDSIYDGQIADDFIYFDIAEKTISEYKEGYLE